MSQDSWTIGIFVKPLGNVTTVIYNSVIPDLFQFDYGELQKNKEAILGNFSDTIDNDKTVPDPGVVNVFIAAHQEFKDM